jgi:hypothetical protein
MEGESLRKICERDGMPHRATVLRWLAGNAVFAANIARAREAQQDFIVDEMLSIADSATEENVNVAKLRIHARQWTAARLAPKKYGDKVEHSGPEGGPLEVVVTRRVVNADDTPGD